MPHEKISARTKLDLNQNDAIKQKNINNYFCFNIFICIFA